MRNLKSCLFFFAILLCAIFSYQKAFADTEINGDIIDSNTTWTKDLGPYNVHISPFIMDGATLTIEPGVLVKFDSGQSLEIFGSLIADGTDAEKVIFTGDSGWSGIDVSTGGSADLKNAEISNASRGIDADGANISLDSVKFSNSSTGIYSTDSTLDIKNSTFDGSYHGIETYSSTSTIDNSSITNTINHPLYIREDSYLILSNSSIDTITDSDGELLDESEGSYVKILNSTINNIPVGPDVYEDSILDFENSTMTNVTKRSGQTFVIYLDSTANISGSTVSGVNSVYGSVIFYDGHINIKNSTFQNFNGYYAFDLYKYRYDSREVNYATSTLEISDSKITGGDTGIYADGGYSFTLKNSTISDFFEDGILAYDYSPITVEKSAFENNGNGIENYGAYVSVAKSSFLNNLNFGIYNDEPAYSPEIIATNNWWGDASGPYNANSNSNGTTSSKVSDNVSFTPWLTKDPAIPLNVPIILIPGIMGSILSKDYGDNGELWPNITGLITSFFDHFMDDLSLTASGTEDISRPMKVGDIMKKVSISGITVLDSWQGMIDKLIAGGYVEGEDLFVFPYDWRKDNSESAVLLKQKVDDVLTETGSSKVDLIAHSMGGLVAKKYIVDNSTSTIDKIFFIGTPHLGAPKAFKALMWGDDMGIKFGPLSFLSSGEVKFISQNMPGVFELLPSKKYVEKYRYIYDGINKNDWLDFQDTENLMASSGRNSSIFPESDSFHDSIDNLDLTSLNSYNFSGCGTTKTIGKITPARKPNIQYVNGDGTVPLFSSDIKAKENYYVSGYEHAELPSANGVPQDILSIIKGETKLDFINISDNQDFCKISGKTVSVHSPVSLDIYDENNNHTGVVSGGNIEYGVSGVSFDEIEGEKFAFLPDGINYKIILNGEATGTFEFDIDSVSGEDQITNTESWTNVPIEGTSSKFEIDIATSSEHFVISDEKGDGNLVELPEGYDGSARDKSSVKRLGRRGTPSESTTTDSVFTGIAKPARPTLLGGQSSINSSLIQDMVEPNTTSSVFASKAKQSRLIPINIKKIQKDNLATSSNIKTTASVLDSGGSGYFSRFFHYIGDFISKIFHKVVK